MKEHSIIFSGPMVRAILEGRKTQTRRVCTHLYDGAWCLDPEDSDEDRTKLIEACLYGAPGDRLWVKEKLVRCQDSEGSIPLALYDVLRTPVMRYGEPARWEWKVNTLSGMFMPRWASRITLEIVNVHVERVQSISREDIEKEGTPGNPMQQESYRNDYFQRWRDFIWLWNNINAKRGYGHDANPWVWAIEFKRLETEPVIAR